MVWDLPHVTSANCQRSNLSSEVNGEKQSLQGKDSFTYLGMDLVALPKCLHLLQMVT